MKAVIIMGGVLCLFLSGCMSVSIDKNEPETTPALSSYELFNVAKKAKLKRDNYTAKKMEWILISTVNL